MLKALALAAAALAATPSFASPQVDALSRCIADSTTGKDRKDLARWLFVAMSAHPHMRSISSVPATATDEVSKIAGTLFTRLLTESCPAQVRAAGQSGGASAIQSAFQVLGQLAMQELMADKDVAASMSVLDKYMDRKKLEALNR